MNFKQKYIGNKAFYKTLFILVLPIIVQQGITNFVSLLDNLMVGALGTHQMSGVSIVNQLIFVFNLAIFGGLSGASIFGTQFYGTRDWGGMRDTFRFKLIFAVITTAVATVILSIYSEPLLMLFLENEANEAGAIASTMEAAIAYFNVAIIGLLPFAIVQAYAGTLRETGETVIPMVAGICAILVNLVFNYLLIYGKFGFPEMGVAGAAVATVMSRFVELAVTVIATHVKHDRFKFIEGVYKSFKVPLALVRKIIITGTPLLINEILWSLGQTAIARNYATRGITVIAATNISGTAWNLFCVIMFAMGSAVSILVGQRLGAGDEEGARDVDRKLLFFTLVSHILIGVLLIATAPFIPMLYNVEEEVRELATQCIMVLGGSLPIHALIHCIYFTVRSGGKTIVTFLFDSFYSWVIPVPLSFILCKYTTLPLIAIYLIIQFSDTIKLFIGIPMLKSGFWTKCIISDVSEKKQAEE